MISNRQIYLKCLDDMKYIRTFESIIKKEMNFIKNHKPIREDFHHVGASKQYLDEINKSLPQIKEDYSFLINYLKEEQLSNNCDDADDDISLEYTNLFEKFCKLSNDTSNMTKEMEMLREKINKRAKNE